jgi:hypothetical protein
VAELAEFRGTSYSMLYDDLIRARLQAELEVNGNPEMSTLNDFLYENIGALPQSVTDYLVTAENPLAELRKTLPYIGGNANADVFAALLEQKAAKGELLAQESEYAPGDRVRMDGKT